MEIMVAGVGSLFGAEHGNGLGVEHPTQYQLSASVWVQYKRMIASISCSKAVGGGAGKWACVAGSREKESAVIQMCALK